MPKRTRESKMLEEVRRWRAEAYESARRESPETRLARAQEWARRLNLPMLDEHEALVPSAPDKVLIRPEAS